MICSSQMYRKFPHIKDLTEEIDWSWHLMQEAQFEIDNLELEDHGDGFELEVFWQRMDELEEQIKGARKLMEFFQQILNRFII